MKLDACRWCGDRFPTYEEQQDHRKDHSNVCVTCNRHFPRQAYLKAHKCKFKDLLCQICHRSYSTQTLLNWHIRKSSCRHSLAPKAKRQKTTPPIEEVEQPPPPLDDEQDPELQDVNRKNWASIRTHKSHGPVKSRYNFRLTTWSIRRCYHRRDIRCRYRVWSEHYCLQHR